MTRETSIPCFKCEKPLQAAAPMDDDRLLIQPYGGVMFRSPGNYGSTVWYPQIRSWELHIIICDECMVSNKDSIIHSQLEQVARYSYKRWDLAIEAG